MLTLVFDTCFNKSYIVLARNNKIIENETIESTDTNYHSVFLISKIRDILKRNNILIKDINAIGVNIGPGSFTGIRAGITIARVLSQQCNTKLVGISSLQILSKINELDTDTIVITDARKNKVYYAKYRNNEILTEPILIDKEKIAEYIKEEKIVTDKSINQYLKSINVEAICYEENDNNLGIYLSELVNNKLEKENDFNWANVKPLYIQPPSITKPKENKNV